MDIQIRFNKEEKEAQAFDGQKKIGFCQYEVKDGNWVITHTVVNKEYGGQGLAGKLLNTVVDAARDEGVKIIPVCSYAVKKFDESDKYKDVDAR
ncbi:MAG: GNAT family N-acetyltransferase [Anaerococcus sp.]|nr:GNAT family N-acetyltransferase [Anaerococcus sp.]